MAVIRSTSLGPVTVTPVTGGKQTCFVCISTIHVVLTFLSVLSILVTINLDSTNKQDTDKHRKRTLCCILKNLIPSFIICWTGR